MRQLHAFDLSLHALERVRKVDLDPLCHLLRTARQVQAVCVFAGHVGRKRVVEAGPFDGDELVVLVFVRDCRRASAMVGFRAASKPKTLYALPKKPAAKFRADLSMRSCTRGPQ